LLGTSKSFIVFEVPKTMETRQWQDKPNLYPLRKSNPPNPKKRITFSMMVMALSYSSNPAEVKSGSFATFALSLKRAKKSMGPTRQLPLPMPKLQSRVSLFWRNKLILRNISKNNCAVQEAKTNTFQLVAERWWNVKKASVTEDYADDIWRSLERDVFPAIGDVSVTDIKAHTLVQAVQPVQARGALETVRRLCQRINEVMIYAQNTGLIDAVPSVNIGKAFEKPQKEHAQHSTGSATSTDADNANSQH
jgi:hypothetical protein